MLVFSILAAPLVDFIMSLWTFAIEVNILSGKILKGKDDMKLTAQPSGICVPEYMYKL